MCVCVCACVCACVCVRQCVRVCVCPSVCVNDYALHVVSAQIRANFLLMKPIFCFMKIASHLAENHAPPQRSLSVCTGLLIHCWLTKQTGGFCKETWQNRGRQVLCSKEGPHDADIMGEDIELRSGLNNLLFILNPKYVALKMSLYIP